MQILFHALHKDALECFTIVPVSGCTKSRLTELLRTVKKRSFMFAVKARIRLRNIFTVQLNIVYVDKAQKDLSHECRS